MEKDIAILKVERDETLTEVHRGDAERCVVFFFS